MNGFATFSESLQPNQIREIVAKALKLCVLFIGQLKLTVMDRTSGK